MKKILVIVLCFLTINLCSEKAFAQHSKTKWLNGIWAGVGYQPDALNQTAWKIVLDYNYSTKEIRIDYPSFPCGGNWRLVKADNNKAVFIENITDGKEKCLDQETVVITKIDENYITVSYFLPEKFKGVISFSTLQKVSDK